MREVIRQFICENFLGGKRVPTDSEALFASGLIDSIGHLRLISFLEKQFKVSLSLEDLNSENFETVEKIIKLLEEKKRHG